MGGLGDTEACTCIIFLYHHLMHPFVPYNTWTWRPLTVAGIILWLRKSTLQDLEVKAAEESLLMKIEHWWPTAQVMAAVSDLSRKNIVRSLTRAEQAAIYLTLSANSRRSSETDSNASVAETYDGAIIVRRPWYGGVAITLALWEDQLSDCSTTSPDDSYSSSEESPWPDAVPKSIGDYAVAELQQGFRNSKYKLSL